MSVKATVAVLVAGSFSSFCSLAGFMMTFCIFPYLQGERQIYQFEVKTLT